MELWVTYGHSGQPFLIGCKRGVLYTLASNVPVDRGKFLTFEHQRWMPVTVDVAMNDIVGRSTHELGYEKSFASGQPVADSVAFGFSVGYGTDPFGVPGTWYIIASIPGWFLGPLLAIYPLWRSIRWWRIRRRRRRGLCPVCAYDLRQSRARCPECGYAIPLAPGSAGVDPGKAGG